MNTVELTNMSERIMTFSKPYVIGSQDYTGGVDAVLPGDTLKMPQEQFKTLANNPSVQADMKAGKLVVSGMPETAKAEASPKFKRE